MFLLLVLHYVFHRRCYGTLAKRPRGTEHFHADDNLSLLSTMLGLLVTSVVVSQTVFAFLLLTSTITARQSRTIMANLVVLVAVVHFGLHWSMIMTAARAVQCRFHAPCQVWAGRGIRLRTFSRGGHPATPSKISFRRMKSPVSSEDPVELQERQPRRIWTHCSGETPPMPNVA